MKQFKHFLALLTFLCLAQISQSQSFSDPRVQINYTNPSGLTICGASGVFQIVVTNVSGSTIAAGSALSVTFPTGVEFTSIAAGTTVGVSAVPATNVNFSLANAVAPGGTVTINYNARANCSTFGLITAPSVPISVGNGISYNYTISGTPYVLSQSSGSALTYNISHTSFIPSLPVPISNAINSYTPVTQTLQVNVTGNASRNNFLFDITVPASGVVPATITGVVLNGTPLTGTMPSVTSISSTLYRVNVLSSTFTGVPTFSPGDVILLTVSYNVTCLPSSQSITYTTGVDCFGVPCYFTNVFGFINPNYPNAALTTTLTNTNPANFCGGVSQFTYTLTNTGAGPAFNVVPNFPIVNAAMNIIPGSFLINGLAVTSGMPGTITSGTPLNLASITTTGGPALSDVNGDLVFSEIPVGGSVVIKFNATFTNLFSLASCPSPNVGTFFRILTNYKQNDCAVSTVATIIHQDGITYTTNSAPYIVAPTDVFDATVNTFKICFDQFINEAPSSMNILFEDDLYYLTADFLFPCGFSVAAIPNPVFQPTIGSPVTLTYTSTPAGGGGTLVTLAIPLGSGLNLNTVSYLQGCISINMLYTCTVGCGSSGTFSATVQGNFGECPTAEQNVACLAQTVYAQGCVAGGCNTIDVTSFDAIRKSYGTDPGTGATITFADILAGLYPTVNKDAAYACDGVQTTTIASVCSTSTGYKAYVTYDLPAGILVPYLIPSTATFKVNSTFYPVTVSAPIITGSTVKYEFTFTGAPSLISGNTLELKVEWTVATALNSWTAFPNNLAMNNFRSGFTDAGGSIYDSFGTNFNIYKVVITPSANSSAMSCGTTVNSNVIRYMYTGGTSGDDFPNENRPVLSFSGPFTLTVSVPGQIPFVHLSNFVINSSSITPATQALTYSQVGGIVTANHPTAWPQVDKKYATDYIYIKFDISLDCEINASVPLVPSLSYVTHGYSPSCITTVPYTGSFSYILNKPVLDLDAINPVMDAVSPNTNFTFEFSNTASTSALLPWAMVTYDNTLVTVTAPSGWTSIDNGAGSLFIQLPTISGFATLTNDLVVGLVNCDVEQSTFIDVELGSSCRAYPVDPFIGWTADHCVHDMATVELRILTSNLVMDVLASNDLDEPVSLCNSPVYYLIQIFNDEKANTSATEISSVIPPGLTLVNAWYRYPISNTQILDPTLNTIAADVLPVIGTFTPISITPAQLTSGLDLSLYGLPSGELPGILSITGSTVYNYYQLLLKFNTGCELSPLVPIEFEASALSNCNEPLSTVESQYLGVTELGNLNDYNPQITMSFAPGANCSTFVATLNYLNNSPFINITPYLSGGDDVIQVNLPFGLTSTLGTSFTFPIPTGTSSTWTFNVTNTGLCNPGDIETNVVVNALVSCTSYTCSTSVNYEDTFVFPSTAPQITMGLTLSENFCLTYSTTANAIATVVNTGTTSVSGLTVSLYCDTDASGFYSPGDAFIGSSGVSVSGSPTIGPGQTGYAVFGFTTPPPCTSGNIIAVVNDPSACNCLVEIAVPFECCLTCTPSNTIITYLGTGPGGCPMFTTLASTGVAYDWTVWTIAPASAIWWGPPTCGDNTIEHCISPGTTIYASTPGIINDDCDGLQQVNSARISCPPNTCGGVGSLLYSGPGSTPCALVNPAYAIGFINPLQPCKRTFTNATTTASGYTYSSVTYLWEIIYSSAVVYSATSTNLTYTFPGSGTYTVKLTATAVTTDGITCTKSYSSNVVITCPTPACDVVPNFTITQLAPCSFRFTNTSTALPGTTITSVVFKVYKGAVLVATYTNGLTTNPTWTTSVIGTYQVCATVTGTLSGGGTCTETLCKPVGTLTACSVGGPKSYFPDDKPFVMRAYPNPNNGLFYIEYSEVAEELGTPVVSVYDMVGRLIYTKQVPSIGGIEEINLDGVEKGTYLLIFSAQNSRTNCLIIVE